MKCIYCKENKKCLIKDFCNICYKTKIGLNYKNYLKLCKSILLKTKAINIKMKINKTKINRRCTYSKFFTCEDRKELFKNSRCRYCNRKDYLTIDRINTNKGYTKDNIQVLCFICNRVKSNLSEKDLFSHFFKVVSNSGFQVK